MPVIETKSNKGDGRTIEVEMPEILQAANLEDLVAIQGEDLTFKQSHAQLVIAFRGKIRNMLESETDGDLTYSDEDIAELDFSDWKPEARTRMSKEEKLSKALSDLDPAELKALLATLPTE